MLRLVLSTVLAVLVLTPALTSAQAADDDDSAPASIRGADPAIGGETPFLHPPANDPEAKACIFVCQTTGTYTPQTWGMGSSCSTANNDLNNKVSLDASSIGPGVCDDFGSISYCGYALVITTACHWNSGLAMYVTDGRGDIKCKDYC